MDKKLLNNIEKKTNINMNELVKLANRLKNANFRDEKTVRQVIAEVSKMANIPVSKEKEEKLVKAVTNNRVPTNFATLSNMIKKD